MNITVAAERPETDKVVAAITIDSADVDKAIDQTYREIARRYAFQGFRRGRAPRPVINGIIGREAVLAQATNDLLNEVQPKVLDELDVVPIGQPSFGEGDDEPGLLVEGSDYEVSMTIEVPPVCELTSYDAPTINMPPEEATDAEVDRQIAQLLSYHTTYEDIDEDRPVEAGDIVMCDIENKEGAAQYAGKNRMLSLDGQALPEQLVDAIVGMGKGETKEVEWTRSHTHGDETHEHTYKLTVTLNAIREAVTPELTDELAKRNFGFDTVDEFRDAVREEVAEDKQQALPSLKEDRVVEAIGERVELDELPEAYESQVFNELANDFLSQLQRQGMSLDSYLGARQIKSDDFIADLHEQAKERARQSLALDAFARHLELEATDEDIRSEFEKAGIADVDAGIAEFTADGRISAIREGIRRTKAVAWLAEHATVVELDEAALGEAESDDDADADVVSDE